MYMYNYMVIIMTLCNIICEKCGKRHCMCNVCEKCGILLPKNCPQAIGNIDKCSTSEAFDESVPGAWLGQVMFSIQPFHKHLRTGFLHTPSVVFLYSLDSRLVKAECYRQNLPVWGHSFNDSNFPSIITFQQL